MTYNMLEASRGKPSQISVDKVQRMLMSGKTHSQVNACCSECRLALRALLTQDDKLKKQRYAVK